MRLRLPVVLAVVAALLWAPSSASAAGNSLVSPSVSPTSGTITTVFALRVRYDGKFPASAVSVSVAGIALPMTRVSGTAEEGTWSVSTLLPAGTWTTTFTASASKGNAASIVGPSISVAKPVADPTPAPTTAGPTPRTRGPEADDPGLPAQPGEPPEPGTAPAETQRDSEPPAAPGPAASEAAKRDPGGGGGGTGAPAGPATPGSSPGGTGDDGGDPAEPAPAASPRMDRPDGSADPAAMPLSDERTDEKPPATFVEDGLLNAVLLIGLSGVAAVAIIGTALLLLGRRRSTRAEEAPLPVPDLGDTEALLERRTLRQAKVRLSDDPITSAMGVDEQVAARRQRRRAEQSGSGPGERPTQPRRPRT
jgi:hypothetical protein